MNRLDQAHAILNSLGSDCPDCGGLGLVVVMDEPTGSMEACRHPDHESLRILREALERAAPKARATDE